MWKRRASKLASECSLHSGNLILYILRLLTKRASGAIWADTLDGVADAFHVADESIRDNWEIGREKAVVIDQKHVRIILRNVATDELRYDFRAYG